MDRRYGVKYSLEIYTKALNEGLLKNRKVLKDGGISNIQNKVIFYTSFREFCFVIRSKKVIEEIKAILFTAYRLNLPNILEWIKSGQRQLGGSRVIFDGGFIYGAKSSLHPKTAKTIREQYEKLENKYSDYLKLFSIAPNQLESKINDISSILKLTYGKDFFKIESVEPFAVDNPYDTKDKKPFELILNYYRNLEQILHNDEDGRLFENYYMSYLLESLQEQSEIINLKIQLQNLASDYENSDHLLEKMEEYELEEIKEEIDRLNRLLKNCIDLSKFNQILFKYEEDKEEARKLLLLLIN